MLTAAAIAPLAAVLALAGTQPKTAEQAGVVTVLSRKGVPISQLGTRDEKEIVVVKDQSPPLVVGAPRGVGELEWMSAAWTPR